MADDLEQFSPLNYLNNTPSNATSTPSAKTLTFTNTKKQQTGGSNKELSTQMKRTKSEFVTREMRKTHAKDMQGPHEPTPSQKIEETDSSIEDDFK